MPTQRELLDGYHDGLPVQFEGWLSKPPATFLIRELEEVLWVDMVRGGYLGHRGSFAITIPASSGGFVAVTDVNDGDPRNHVRFISEHIAWCLLERKWYPDTPIQWNLSWVRRHASETAAVLKTLASTMVPLDIVNHDTEDTIRHANKVFEWVRSIIIKNHKLGGFPTLKVIPFEHQGDWLISMDTEPTCHLLKLSRVEMYQVFKLHECISNPTFFTMSIPKETT